MKHITRLDVLMSALERTAKEEGVPVFVRFVTTYPGAHWPEIARKHVDDLGVVGVNLSMRHASAPTIVEDKVIASLTFDGHPATVVIPLGSIVSVTQEDVGVFWTVRVPEVQKRPKAEVLH